MSARESDSGEMSGSLRNTDSRRRQRSVTCEEGGVRRGEQELQGGGPAAGSARRRVESR